MRTAWTISQKADGRYFIMPFARYEMDFNGKIHGERNTPLTDEHYRALEFILEEIDPTWWVLEKNEIPLLVRTLLEKLENTI